MPMFSIPTWEAAQDVNEYLDDVSDANKLAASILHKMNRIMEKIAGTPRRSGVLPIRLDLTDAEAESFEIAVDSVDSEQGGDDVGDRLGITSSYWGT